MRARGRASLAAVLTPAHRFGGSPKKANASRGRHFWPTKYYHLSIPFSNIAQVCQPVESFGLSETTFRRLKSPLFRGQAYVYVGDIHVSTPLNVYVFIGNPRLVPHEDRRLVAWIKELVIGCGNRYTP